MSTFNQWVNAIAEAGRELLASRFGDRTPLQRMAELCEQLCTSRGEALGTAIADEVVRNYAALSAAERADFFAHLATHYGHDQAVLAERAADYASQPDQDKLAALQEALESPRRELFRRINMAPNGTATLVRMRSDLLALLDSTPEPGPELELELGAVDRDLEALLTLWFNRGFLSLEQISWRTPALILEKLIAYEAVHAMSGWDDLRRRLESDRRCFAFFHPALEEEPLIFVEVALVDGMASSVQALLAPPSVEAVRDADTAIFYSISNCQPGLKGISFGNFLIKQVVAELAAELPELKQFATLSPIPGFRRWLQRTLAEEGGDLVTSAEREQLQLLESEAWSSDPAADALQPLLMRLCAHYLANEKHRDGRPLDPVARFHLGNGAAIARLNWLGDTSANGLRQSYGLLVNYAYELKSVEENHEAFVNDGRVATTGDFRKLLPRAPGWNLFGRSQRRAEAAP